MMKCEPGCQCGKHNRPVREKCEPGCRCRHHQARKCDPGCQCGRHRKSRDNVAAVVVVTALFRLKFFAVMPSPYICVHCDEVINHQLGYQDGDSLVLHRIDGDYRNTVIGNLEPMHKRCAMMVSQLARRQTCECGMVTNKGAMAAHVKRTGHLVRESTVAAS